MKLYLVSKWSVLVAPLLAACSGSSPSGAGTGPANAGTLSGGVSDHSGGMTNEVNKPQGGTLGSGGQSELTGSGGVAKSGGSSSAVGGSNNNQTTTSAAGGQSGSGGSPLNGGTKAVGGAPSTGGTATVSSSNATGGSVAATGTKATGGTSSAGGNSANGGTKATGGTTATSGTSTSSTGALIRNDQFWKDTSGTPIYSQGGGVLKVGDTYYWYGVKYKGAVTYAANPSKLNSDTSFNAVTCYSSQDLVNWQFENNVLTATGSGTEIAGSSWIGRLGVAYNATTKKYVLVTQYAGTAGTGELFATSDTPAGNFVFNNIQSPVANIANGSTGDQTVFVDDDGKAYVICSSANGRGNLYVAPLRAKDYLAVDTATRIFGGVGREGNTMFKYNGHYYFCSSDLHGWNASHTYCISATNILGPYGAEFIMAGTDSDFSHVTQTGFFITVNGSTQSTVIFAGDRWSDFAGNGLGYNQWMPLSFNGTTPQFQSLSEWSLNATTGQWTVGPNNNYALNPSFEADRVTTTLPAGWTATGGTNLLGGHSGRWSWQLSGAASLNQSVANLPNGTYTLSVWLKGSGATGVQLYAKGFGGTDKATSISAAGTAWTQMSVTGIAVSNGQCQIGITTTAGTIGADDFVLVKN